MAFQPVVAQVEILGAEVGDREVNSFTVVSDGQSELHKFSDIARLVAGTVSVVYCNGDGRLSGVESVFLDEGSVNCAARAATVNEGLGAYRLSSGAGTKLEVLPEEFFGEFGDSVLTVQSVQLTLKGFNHFEGFDFVGGTELGSLPVVED
ncbi:uncharacterized protein ARMOST_08554 [Armillaria ostoyae]|uniref:Uncharacterized protein n=1 Tax=Armillaria ostoyae TaxID=47428 RepID=A0A284R8X4_ARMOS|nr:uncharacterized protein ARMOST_08554 [Armillaria ostoyae]